MLLQSQLATHNLILLLFVRQVADCRAGAAGYKRLILLELRQEKAWRRSEF